MDIREFSNKIAEATKNMSDAERQSLMNIFASVSKDIADEFCPQTDVEQL